MRHGLPRFAEIVAGVPPRCVCSNVDTPTETCSFAEPDYKHRGDQDLIVAGEPSVLRVTGPGHLWPKEASKSLPAFLKVIRRYASFRVALGWR